MPTSLLCLEVGWYRRSLVEHIIIPGGFSEASIVAKSAHVGYKCMYGSMYQVSLGTTCMVMGIP